jgi:hypothetical protein
MEMYPAMSCILENEGLHGAVAEHLLIGRVSMTKSKSLRSGESWTFLPEKEMLDPIYPRSSHYPVFVKSISR